MSIKQNSPNQHFVNSYNVCFEMCVFSNMDVSFMVNIIPQIGVCILLTIKTYPFLFLDPPFIPMKSSSPRVVTKSVGAGRQQPALS